ncbi:CopG family antitoxin [Methylobacterium sp.]|uniref:CopG family antitoxin n=1 Tax=Methylobacterium sp. TaxID=409 RepID=UPI0025E799A1|nr:CopG family antitoxin [Methylobacterium sp.]
MAEEFLETDLSDLDFSQFQPVNLATGQRNAQVSMRVPEPLLDAVKLRAKARGISHGRYIRDLMERDVARRTPEAPRADGVSARDDTARQPAEERGRTR